MNPHPLHNHSFPSKSNHIFLLQCSLVRFVPRTTVNASASHFRSSMLRMAVKPMTRSFATRFYDSPLFHSLQKEYQSASETEEKGKDAKFVIIKM